VEGGRRAGYVSRVSAVEERAAAVHDEVASIDGWLQPGDTQKLYELGTSAPGPFLEVGTYRGKSTAVLTTALRDSGREVEFYSLDIAADDQELARAALAARGLAGHVTLVHGSLRALFRAMPTFAPRFVFLDGDHSEGGVARDLTALETRVPEGALLLFHDFRDPRNEDPDDRDYGVPQAVRASWVARDCEFLGEFGCAGLYRRVRGPGGGDDGRAPIDLIGLDRPGVRLLVNVARPVKRYVVRRLRALRRR
jgi:predicted O-methyltransferase YrrM